MDNVGTRLALARKRAGLSARQLDRYAGRHQGQCALVEARGQRVLNEHAVKVYAAVLGCDPAWLALGIGDTPDADALRAAGDAAKLAHGDPVDDSDDPTGPVDTRGVAA